jgi:hypothetical protein
VCSSDLVFAGVLASVAGAKDLDGLALAAERAYDLAQDLATATAPTADGQDLINAEIALLQGFSGLDSLTPDDLTKQFPAHLGTIKQAATAVRQAMLKIPGSDPATDPTPAITTVEQVLGPPALDGLTTSLGALVTQAGKATTTADLRDVVATARPWRVAAEDTTAALGTDGALAQRAADLAGAYSALHRLEKIDGDTLGTWDSAGPALRTYLSDLDQDTGPVARVDEMIAAAKLVMKTWEDLQKGDDRESVQAYIDKITRVSERAASVWKGLPVLKPGEIPAFRTTTRLYNGWQTIGTTVDRKSVV